MPRSETRAYPMAAEQRTVDVRGVVLHVAAAGPASGPLLILLHGFPENAYGWRHQIHPLAKAGWRVVAPDQRGYGYSAKPEGVHAYAIDTLADDIDALIETLGEERAAIVGHDWGGLVAWQLLRTHPGRVRRAAILNAPHPATLLSYAAGHPLQLLRSSYVAFFQLPLLPEAWLRAGDHALLRWMLTATSRPGAFDDATLEVYRRAWSQPGALTAMLDWYRALALGGSADGPAISAPVRILWGDRDAALQSGLAEHAAATCTRAEVIHFPECTHWLQHEAPDAVNAALLDFLGTPARHAR